MDRDQFWLDEGQFARLAPHLPTDTRGKPRVDDRRVISGIVHVLKSGGRQAQHYQGAAQASAGLGGVDRDGAVAGAGLGRAPLPCDQEPVPP
jgi:hypothetical protein